MGCNVSLIWTYSQNFVFALFCFAFFVTTNFPHKFLYLAQPMVYHWYFSLLGFFSDFCPGFSQGGPGPSPPGDASFGGLGRSGTLDVDRVLTHCSTSSRTSRDSKMPSASSDSGGYGQIMKSPFFWGGHFCSFGKETPVTVMTFSTEREQLSLDRWKIDPRCHENGTPLVARSPKVLQPVNPHRDVLRRRLAHGDSVSEARIPFDLHRFTTFKFSFESKAVIWEFVKPPRLFV